MSNGESQASSTRRIISRNKPIEEELSHSSSRNRQSDANHGRYSLKPPPTVVQAPKDNKENSATNEMNMTTSSQQQQLVQHNLAMNYINKEPFNEDVEVEESNLYVDNKWRQLVIDKFKETIADIKKLQTNPSENVALIKEKYKKGLLLCTTIKKLNRISHVKVNKARIKTHEEKNKIDEYHLELQNLLYEISYFKKEINKCLDFRSLHEDISLVPLDEFYSKAPSEISNPEVTRINEHKLKLAQLDWELIERQNMTGRIKELENLIDLHEKQLKSKQNKLESLHPKLNQILEACKPTLEYFNTNFDEDCMFSELVQHLPKPLYQFYIMMSAYRDTIDKEVTKIEVCGDLDEAKKFNLNDTISLDDDDSGDSANEDDNDHENYKKKKSKNSKSHKKKPSITEKLFTCFPLSCKVTFTIQGYGQFSLEFFYLNILKIVTLKSDFKLQKEINFSETSILKTESIFDCIYENDSGLESPNLANKFLFNNMGVKSIEPYLKMIGTPYRWCQILCGLYYENKFDRQSLIYSSAITTTLSPSNQHLPKLDQSTSHENENVEMNDEEDALMEDENEVNESGHLAKKAQKNESKMFEQILNKVKFRFKSRIILQETINSLKHLTLPQTDSYSIDKLKFKVQSSLISFKDISFEKFTSHRQTKNLVDSCSHINDDECDFFELTAKYQNATLNALIVINQDYPKVYPLFIININWKHERNNLNDESVRDMEREINLYREYEYQHDDGVNRKTGQISANFRLGQDDKNNFDLFAKQINHLLVCFDIYLESESYNLDDCEYQRSKLFPSSVRGRDRKRPYSYLSNMDLFVQRMQFGSKDLTI